MFRELISLMSGSGSIVSFAITLFSVLIVLIISFPVHECAHGIMAYWLGDDTAMRSGRLTLNPIAHLDLFGTIAMLLFGIGWAKPVPVNPSRCRKVKSGKAAMALTAAAGPVSNVLVAFIFLIIAKILFYTVGMTSTTGYWVCTAVNQIVTLNLYLGVFNLIPIPPFDGSRIFLSFLSTKAYFKVMQYERYIMIGILVLLWTGILSIPLEFLTNLLYGGLNFLTGFIDLLMG